jgi:uncharacterized protein YjiS (DUF1127 family)
MEIGAMDLLKEVHRTWALRREFRATLRELAAYSDRELAELGLGRGDVARVAYEEAERRIGTPHPRNSSSTPTGWYARTLPTAR